MDFYLFIYLPLKDLNDAVNLFAIKKKNQCSSNPTSRGESSLCSQGEVGEENNPLYVPTLLCHEQRETSSLQKLFYGLSKPQRLLHCSANYGKFPEGDQDTPIPPSGMLEIILYYSGGRSRLLEDLFCYSC